MRRHKIQVFWMLSAFWKKEENQHLFHILQKSKCFLLFILFLIKVHRINLYLPLKWKLIVLKNIRKHIMTSMNWFKSKDLILSLSDQYFEDKRKRLVKYLLGSVCGKDTQRRREISNFYLDHSSNNIIVNNTLICLK